jgi:hypothetical protein
MNVFDAITSFPALEVVGLSGMGLRPDVNKLMVLGHSNGGQGKYSPRFYANRSMTAIVLGAWYLMSRFPDRVVGGVPASGYVKIQDYVPYIQSDAARFQDPSLRGVRSHRLLAARHR